MPARLRTARQVAALPFVVTSTAVEVLLITTRRRGRWIVPKGWPMRGLSGPESARYEAMEEAGVDGHVGTRALGTYRYAKRLEDEREIGATVSLYPLLVVEQRLDWPEKSERRTAWRPLDEAVRIVEERGLARLMAPLAASDGRALKVLARELARPRVTEDA